MFHSPPRAADTCPYCVGSDGQPKKSYPSEADAEASADHRWSRGGPRLRVYPCPATDAWHLTKS
jgi:hypothetical protein